MFVCDVFLLHLGKPVFTDAAKPVFIFFPSISENSTLRDQIAAIWNKILPLEIKELFRGFQIVFAGVVTDGTGDTAWDPNTFVAGANAQFNQLLANKLNPPIRSPGYVFYMEPDCRPVRNGWLDALKAAVDPPQEMFWIKGSGYRGDPVLLFTSLKDDSFYRLFQL